MTAEVVPLRRPKQKRFKPLEGERNLQVYIKTGMIYAAQSFKKQGIPNLFEATGFTIKNKLKAKRKAQDLVIAHQLKHMGHDGQIINRQKVLPVREVIERILKEYTVEQRFGTQYLHKHYFEKFNDRFGDMDIEALTVRHFNEWIANERRRPVLRKMRNGEVRRYAPRRTFCDYAKYGNVIMNYARDNNLTKNLTVFPNPDAKARKIMEQKRREEDRTGRQLLTEEEREILELKSSRVMTRAEIDELHRTLTGDLRDQFTLAFTCIMRLREAIEAPWSEIDLERGTWSLPMERVKTGSKTGEGREFYLSPEALEMLRARKKAQGGRSRFVFPGWSQRNPGVDKPVNSNKTAWGSAKRKAGITTRLRWHDIRHTALTFAILGDPHAAPEQNANIVQDPFKVAKFAGVSLRTIEAVYLHTHAEQTKAVSGALRFKPCSNQVQTNSLKQGH